MSLSPSEDLSALRKDLEALQDRVSVLEAQARSSRDSTPSTVVPVTVNYTQSGPADSAPSVSVLGPTQLPEAPTPGLTPGGRITASQYTEEYRRSIAQDIGDYFRRCLSGTNRGPSGRQQISLPSKVYILVRELDGLPLSPADVLRQCAVLSSESGQLEPEYPLGFCEVTTSTGESERVAVICMGEMGGAFLVVTPHSAGHRQVAKRQLPSTFLSKPTSAEVLFAPSRDPGAHTVNSKVWFGWLSKDYESHISFDTASGPALTVLFDEDELMLPLASSLALAAERLFGLRAAPSSFESVPAEDTQVLGQRVAALENHLSGIKEQLEILIGQNTHPRTSGSPATQKAEGARPKSSAAPPRASQFLGLDPTVAQAALAAGIPATQLEEMSKLALAGKPRLPDLPKAPMPKRKDPLDESEDDAVGESAVEVTKETSLEALLDGSGYPGSSESAGVPSARKNAAALRALKKTLSSDLEQISRVIERNMEADFNLRRSGVPGAPVVPVSARAWLEARSRVQNFRTPVTFLWGVAGILDALRDQKPEEARARAGLLLCQGDQLSIDRGSWIVAASMSLEDPPPFAVFATHTLPAETESQVTKLIDSRWVDLFLHHLSEIDQLAEKKKKLTFKKTPLDPPPDGTASPKRKGKGKGSGSAGSGKDAGREKEKEAAHPVASEPVPGSSMSEQGALLGATALLGPGRLLPDLRSQDLAADAYPPRGEVRAGALLRQTHSSVKGPPSEIAEEAKPTVPAEAEKKPEHRAPGASASTVNARGLWNSLLRWVLRSPCGTLRTFLHTALHSPAPEGDLHDPRPEWPIPLPYPALLAGAREATEDDAWRRCANMMVLILNWIHMGQPAIWPRKFSIFSSLTPSQLVLVTRLKHLAGEWLKFKDITAESMGRTAGKVESLEALVHRLETSAVAFVPKSGSGNGPVHRAAAGEDTAVQVEDIQAAKAVEAGRLSFKGRPAFDPTPYLEEPARSLYQDPLKFAVPPSECFEEIPTVKVRGDRKEILGLLSSLDSTGRLALFSPDELRMDFRAGVFALMKNLTADRLILDCRPANALEPGLNQWTQTMGSLTPILGMRIPPDHKVVAAGEDLKDYYYYIISESRAKRNSLAFQLSRAEAKRFRGAYRWADRQARILIPALKTMAMGDLNAVEFGQQAHVKLGLLHGLVGMRDLLTLRGRFPRQSWAVGYVIDDFIVLEAVPKSSVPAPLFSSRLADAMVDVYSHVGLVANDSKRFRAEEHPQFWGISIDGNSGLVRALLDRTIPLSFVTARVARTGAASRHLLEIIAGSWTAIIAARKRCMCLLQQIFVEIQAHEYGVVFRISPQLVAELWTLVVLAPLMCSDLTAPTSTTLYAVDASDQRIAGVVTELTAPFAKELSRHTMTRAAWSRLLSPWKSHQRRLGRLDPADEVPEGEAPAQAHLLWVQLMRSCQFYPMFCDRAARSEHINVSEMRGLLKAEAHHSSEQPSTRCNIGTDSQVCLEAVVKGRASSVVLNKMLRRHLPVLLCGNLYPGHQYLPSSDNPADDPTRDKELREPVETAPKWLVEAFEGDFRSLDDMLKASSADEATLARLPEFEDSAIPPDWLRSDRQLLRRDYRNRHCSAEHRTAVTGLPNNPAPDLWKTEDQVKLHPAAEQLLRKLPESYFVFPKSWNRKQRRTSLSFTGALDLFSGSRGLAKSLARHTQNWVLTYDIAHDPRQDLLDPSVQAELDALVQRKCFRLLSAGPVCSSFSRAVRPPVRSRQFPRGLECLSSNMQRKVAEGNAFSSWLAALIKAACSQGCIFLVENPWMSFLWDQPEWQDIADSPGSSFFVTDFCVWGTPWRKRTKFLTNTSFQPCKLFCRCGSSHEHLRLSGYSRKHRKPWTKVAEAYPAKLCGALALVLANQLLPPSRQRKLDLAACAHVNSRVGEASKPGPRPRRPRPAVDLEEVQLVTAHTSFIQQKARALFAAWLATELSEATWRNLEDLPELCVIFLRAFGRHLFASSQPLYLFRHLVVYFQRNYPVFPAPLSEAWDLIARWERIQPVEHRTPMPKLIFDAVVSLAYLWGWYRFAAVTLLAFHGKLRISEPLKAARKDLLLPAETGVGLDAAFLNIEKSKTSFRGKGIVQHTKITDGNALAAADRILKTLSPEERLYAGTPSTYRRRWDALLRSLQIDKSWQLTPGTLRSGGAIYAYHSGVPVTEILWLMRLKNLTTLESYLQSTAAMNIMLKLPDSVRGRIQVLAQTLPHLVRHSPSSAQAQLYRRAVL
ncbi:unnamed protein product [Durusdinium trenchii]|uniref:Calmodulin n=1 Tax=Durusdinium trenchii TaxID=1381693 RepID=A0ABP0RES1_9DINO